MEYSDFFKELREAKEKNPAYADFQKKILSTEKEIIGVRTPELRKIIKKHKGEYFAFKDFPSDVYEVAFIKICLAAHLGYEELISELDDIIKIMDSWALTDAFSSDAVKANREDFKRYIGKYISDDGIFSRRLALVILLKYYVDKENIPYALECVERCERSPYYVSMAAAWLVAEIIIKDYGAGLNFLKKRSLDRLTINRAVQKCRDSFRLTDEQKEEIKLLKMS